jgi:ABC-type glutathione transport system ATPase component
MMRGIAREGGVGFLITTHETDVVAKYADRVVVMQQGIISHDGPAEAVSMDDMLELLR